MEAFFLDVIKILVTFIVSGLIGNYVLQAWQARNWFAQQRFLGQEKEYSALKEMLDELATLLAIRIFYMTRLLRVIAAAKDDRKPETLMQYDQAVKKWNERLSSFYVKLPILVPHRNLAWNLEQYIQNALVETGLKLERLVRTHESGQPITTLQRDALEREINRIQGAAINFNKVLLVEVLAKRADVYYGRRMAFTQENFKYFSTWKLVKALFVRDIDSLAVSRTPLDP
jgi:hypothetical protein